jgi:hypothetical protein
MRETRCSLASRFNCSSSPSASRENLVVSSNLCSFVNKTGTGTAAGACAGGQRCSSGQHGYQRLSRNYKASATPAGPFPNRFFLCAAVKKLMRGQAARRSSSRCQAGSSARFVNLKAVTRVWSRTWRCTRKLFHERPRTLSAPYLRCNRPKIAPCYPLENVSYAMVNHHAEI